MAARDLAHQAEAKADAAGRFARAGNSVERLEDVLALGFGNPGPPSHTSSRSAPSPAGASRTTIVEPAP